MTWPRMGNGSSPAEGSESKRAAHPGAELDRALSQQAMNLFSRSGSNIYLLFSESGCSRRHGPR